MIEQDNTPKVVDTTRNEGLRALGKSLKASLVWLYLLIAIMIGTILAQSFFIVKDHEMGVIYRFGSLRALVEPGLHFTWPYPIEEKITFNSQRSKQVESTSFMFAKTKSGAQVPESLRPGIDGYLLTGDMGIVHARCNLEYTIDSSSQTPTLNYYIFTKEGEAVLKAFFDNAVLKAAASLGTDKILKNIDIFRGRIASLLRKNINKIELGISFETKNISVVPRNPRQVDFVFDAYSNASQDRDRMIRDAKSYCINKETQAKSLQNLICADARIRKVEIVSNAATDKKMFNVYLKQYEVNPKLVKKRLYQEALFRIFDNVDEKFIVTKGTKNQLRILLGRNLDREKKSDKK